jgi:RNA polymerase sigma factor (sigma-70 family)
LEKLEHYQFIELYEPVHKQLSKFCRAISGNKENAEDLMNDTILVVLENMNKMKDKTMFKSYLFSIASNLNKMRFRRSKFHADFDEKEVRKIIDNNYNPEYQTEFRIIYETILSLPQKMSETLILFHISDLTLEEIQEVQGGSLSGVKLRLKRGREKLLIKLNTPMQKELALMLLTL